MDLTIGTDDWTVVRTTLRTTDVAEDRFHPFFHEIVAVQEADDPDEQPSLVAEHWPGAFIGTLMLVRAGVTIRAGRNVLACSERHLRVLRGTRMSHSLRTCLVQRMWRSGT